MPPFLRLDEQVALVTGGASGIGAATARLFAEAGAAVGVLDQDEGGVDQLVGNIRESGGTAAPLVADISSAPQMRAAVDKLVEQHRRLDIVFANAGVNGTWAPLDELDVEDWDRTIDINLRGTFLTLKYTVPHLKQSGGSIVINASVNGTRIFSNTGATAYACSKAAGVALAKMAALELAQARVRVNVICPGAIETAIHDKTEKEHLDQIGEPVEYPEGAIPLTDGAPGKPEQVAGLVLFLASPAADHITGTEIWIDGGESLLMG